jgi:hypothetical protein
MTEPWVREGQFAVSPFNYDDAVLGGRRNGAGSSTSLYDSTIRKILLTPGLNPPVGQLVEIARALEEAGIRNLTLNIHWWGDPEPEPLEYDVAKAVLAGDFRFTTTITVDNVYLDHWQGDLEELCDLGLEEPTFISWLPTVLADTAPDPDREARLMEAVAYSRKLGMRPCVIIPDVGRVRGDELFAAVQRHVDAGVARLDLADSVSSMAPHATAWLFDSIRERGADVPLLLHIHDDFGLATANAVAAITAGGVAEVSVNGISDHAGFPALEEVAIVLESMYGIATGLDMSRMASLCSLVAEITRPVHPWKAISGTQAWQIDLPYGYVPFLRGGSDQFPPAWGCLDASWLGYTPVVQWVRQFANGTVLELKLRQLGLPHDEASIDRARAAVEVALRARNGYPCWLTDAEVNELLHDAVAAH